jgi:heme exporter protein B
MNDPWSIIEEGRNLWWLVHKDLLREIRAPRTLPVMLLLAIVLTVILEMQVDLPREQKWSLAGSMYWISVFFAGTVALDRSVSAESDEGCWRALRLYPVTPATVFLAKLTSNFVTLCLLAAVLVPIFQLFCDVPIAARPWPFLAVVLFSNLGFAALGTVLSALTKGLKYQGNMLTLLLLPMISPLMLGAAQATRCLIQGDINEWWQWTQLLACFATTFASVGALVFEFVIEE